MMVPGQPYQPPMNRGPMKPSPYQSLIARIPENRPRPNPLGGGTAPMQRPPRPMVDSRLALAQKMAALGKQRQANNRLRYAG